MSLWYIKYMNSLNVVFETELISDHYCYLLFYLLLLFIIVAFFLEMALLILSERIPRNNQRLSGRWSTQRCGGPEEGHEGLWWVRIRELH